MANGYNSGNSGSGWNRANSWYNIPQYGNYAPPPYATSRSALIQIGPLPAFGGVRSLPGWGGPISRAAWRSSCTVEQAVVFA